MTQYADNLFLKSLIWVVLFNTSIVYLFSQRLASLLDIKFGRAEALALFIVSFVILSYYCLMERFEFYRKTETMNHNVGIGDIVNLLFYSAIIIIVDYLRMSFLLVIIGLIISMAVYELIKSAREGDDDVEVGDP